MLSLLVTLQALAGPTSPRSIFINQTGQTITLEQAFEVSAKAGTVYRCQEVEAVMSKTGTSMSLKVVKK